MIPAGPTSPAMLARSASLEAPTTARPPAPAPAAEDWGPKPPEEVDRIVAAARRLKRERVRTVARSSAATRWCCSRRRERSESLRASASAAL